MTGPEGARGSSECRGCGATIWWIETTRGKFMPINEDGSSHFSTCPKAELFRRAKRMRRHKAQKPETSGLFESERCDGPLHGGGIVPPGGD